MRASQIAFVAMAALVADFSGGFVGGFLGALVRSGTLGIALMIPAALGAAHLIGRWVGRRADAPGPHELITGAACYAGICILMGLASQHPVPIAFALVGGGGVGWVLCRAALASRAELQGGKGQDGRAEPRFRRQTGWTGPSQPD